jgi:hypothetical protein
MNNNTKSRHVKSFSRNIALKCFRTDGVTFFNWMANLS